MKSMKFSANHPLAMEVVGRALIEAAQQAGQTDDTPGELDLWEAGEILGARIREVAVEKFASSPTRILS